MLCQGTWRKPHTKVYGRSLSTRELLSLAILCAEKSIKDFSCIQMSRTNVLERAQDVEHLDEYKTNLGFPQEAKLLDGCQKSEIS